MWNVWYWVIKRVVEMSNQKILFKMDSNCWNLRGGRIWFWRVWMTFSHLNFIPKKVTKRRFRLAKSFELPKMSSNPFAKQHQIVPSKMSFLSKKRKETASTETAETPLRSMLMRHKRNLALIIITCMTIRSVKFLKPWIRNYSHHVFRYKNQNLF